MGPCATCGQPTEPELDFCPACAGYAAPATIYAYAPGRLSHSDAELEQMLAPLAVTSAPADESRTGEVGARISSSAAWRRESRWLVASAMLIVLIIAAGTALLEIGHPGPATSARAGRAAATSAPPASPAVSPSPPGLQVSVATPAAASPHEAVVLSFLTSYFTAINNHDFAAYQGLFSVPLQADLSPSSFSAGYGTTTDSAIRLTDIAVIGSGELVAQVSFISHQQPTASPTDSACTSWTVSLYLLQQDGSYLLQQPPPGYQASYSACP